MTETELKYCKKTWSIIIEKISELMAICDAEFHTTGFYVDKKQFDDYMHCRHHMNSIMDIALIANNSIKRELYNNNHNSQKN